MIILVFKIDISYTWRRFLLHAILLNVRMFDDILTSEMTSLHHEHDLSFPLVKTFLLGLCVCIGHIVDFITHCLVLNLLNNIIFITNRRID